MMASEGAQMQRRSNSAGSMAPPGLDGPPHDVEGGLGQERYDYTGGKSKGFQSLRGKSGAPPVRAFALPFGAPFALTRVTGLLHLHVELGQCI